MKNRIVSLDSFKAVCAFMIIFLHYGVDQAEVFNMYFRIAVPFFFAVSGFFLYDDTKEVVTRRCKKNIKKLLFLNIWVCLALIIKYACVNLLKGRYIDFSFLIDWKFLIFNFNFASYLWFVRALIYVYAVINLFMRTHKEKRQIDKSLMILAGICIIASLLLCKYSKVLGLNIPADVYEIPCKFIGNAFGGFMIGYYIGCQKDSLLSISDIALVIILAMCLVIGGTEYYWLSKLGVNNVKCDYISTFAITIIVFLILLKHVSWSPKRLHIIGEKYSLWIYILHMNIKGMSEKFPWKLFDWTPQFVQDLLKVVAAFILCVLIAFAASQFLSVLKLKVSKQME